MSHLNVYQTNDILGFKLSVRRDPSKLTDLLRGRKVHQNNKNNLMG